MEIVREPDTTVEVHVRMTRGELESLLSDMMSDCTHKDPYTITEEFMTYLGKL